MKSLSPIVWLTALSGALIAEGRINAASHDAAHGEFLNAVGASENKDVTPIAVYHELQRMEQGVEALHHRLLQTSTGNTADLNATSDVCSYGARLTCGFQTTYTSTGMGSANGTTGDGSGGSYSNVSFNFNCDFDSQIAGDFRVAQNCACGVSVSPSDPKIMPKTCACSICPKGFGPASIAIDCTAYDGNMTEDQAFIDKYFGGSPQLTADMDPFIVDTCSSFDCGFACNGTCKYSCEDSPSECEFCANANPPTPAPTGDGAGGSGALGAGSNENATSGSVRAKFLFSVAALVGVAVLGSV
jgi:hypothetical protein